MTNDAAADGRPRSTREAAGTPSSLREGLTIRRAIASDAEAIAHVHHTAWQEAYPGRIPQPIFESVTLERRLDQWTHGLAPGGRYDDGGGIECLVAVDARDDRPSGGYVVGFVTAGAPQPRDDGIPPDLPAGTREVLSLYVLASHHGTGAARALVDAVIPPASPAVVWMLDDNPRARAFYAKCGFVLDVTRWDARLPGSEILERRMLRGCTKSGHAAGDRAGDAAQGEPLPSLAQ